MSQQPFSKRFIMVRKLSFLSLTLAVVLAGGVSARSEAEKKAPSQRPDGGPASASPFPGPHGRQLDLFSRQDIWDKHNNDFLARFVKVARDEVVAFALYTHDHRVLKMTAQLYPLQPEEAREVRLEFKIDGQWREVAEASVIYPGWSAHFRIEPWDSSQDVPYRVRHGEKALFEGLIRKDPVDKDVIVVGSLSCDSNADRGDRDQIVQKLKRQDPDLCFFAGDQSYDHTEHTAAWLLWGHQFREIIKDRPVVTIPDDHDVGQGNVWGEGGIVADSTAGDSGGYYYPPEYIRMIERCQTWHLPDPVDPAPIAQDIPVYFTRLRVGGVDFAILADRQFKSGPKGKIPLMGPRPDHIRQSGYDPKRIDLPGLKLLGDRQLAFLNAWGQDWTGAEMKAVLSQTALCGAAHLHGSKENRLLADLDCNGWPRYADLDKGDAAQYPGWPITFRMEDNDGRKVFGYLPGIVSDTPDPVVQVVREADGEILYTLRIQGSHFRPRVYRPGKYTVKAGRDKPDAWSVTGLTPDAQDAKPLKARLGT
jgi:hypothetical protein